MKKSSGASDIRRLVVVERCNLMMGERGKEDEEEATLLTGAMMMDCGK